MGIAEVFRAIAIRRRLVALLTALLFAAVVGATYLVRPSYEAIALVEVLPNRAEAPSAAGASAAGGAEDAITLNTEAGKLVADSTARTVFRHLSAEFAATVGQSRLASLPALQGALATLRDSVCGWEHAPDGPCRTTVDERDAEEALFRAFRKSVSVEPVRGARLLRITATAPDPRLAARIANAFADEHLRIRTGERDRQNEELIAWLDTRLDALRQRASRADEAVARFRGSTNLIEMGKQADEARRSPATEELAATLTNLAQARSARAEAEAKLARLREFRNNPAAAAGAAEVAGSQIVRDLLARETAARQRLAELGSIFGGRHPQAIAAQSEMADLRARIDREISRVLTTAVHEYENVSATVEGLSRDVVALQQRAHREDMDRVGLRELERTASVEAGVYAGLLRLARHTEERRSWPIATLAVASRAMPPDRPVFPNKRVLLPLGLIASGCFAALVGVFTELRRQASVFVDPSEVERSLGLRVAGLVPRFRRFGGRAAARQYTLAIEDIGFRVLEAASGSARVIAVTSSVPGEGKSTLALSVARWLAACGTRAILVDADLRRPRPPGAHADGQGEKVIQAEAPALEDMPLLVEAKTGLHVLQLAEVGSKPVHVLSRLPRLLAQLRDHYEVVVVDTPPLLAVGDALPISAAADETLFAVRWAVTPRHSVEFALGRLSAEDRERARIVLTMIEPRGYRLRDAAGSERYGSAIAERYAALPVGVALTETGERAGGAGS